MDKWQLRPDVLKNLLNPAYMSIIIASIARGYRDECHNNIDFALLQIATTLFFNRAVRDRLPRNKTNSMPGWIQENIGYLIGIYDKSNEILQYIKEGILWGHAHEVITISLDSEVIMHPDANERFFKSIRKNNGLTKPVRSAEKLGKWFAHAGSTDTVLQIWRILL